MKTNKILPTLILLLITLCVKSQEKYQFIIIEYEIRSSKLTASIDGKEIFEEKINYSKNDKLTQEVNPLLNKVKEYQEQDWELMSFNAVVNTSGYYTYIGFMRKRK